MSTPRTSDFRGSQPIPIKIFLVGNLLLWGHAAGTHLALTVITAIALGAYSPPSGRWYQIMALVVFGLVIFFAGPCSDSKEKVLASFVAIAAVLYALDTHAQHVRVDAPLLTPKEAITVLWIIVLAAAAEFAVEVLNGRPWESTRTGGLFTEPSHLALSATPLLAYIWATGKVQIKFLALLAITVLALTSYSSTLVFLILLLNIGLLFASFRAVRSNLTALLSAAALLTSTVIFLLFGNHERAILSVADILDLRPESNLSSLVYVNGWQLLIGNLESSNGLGLGFNAMGCDPRPFTEITEWLTLFELEDQNYNDGSFMLSKVGSEFGYLGLGIFAAISIFSLLRLFSIGRPDTNSPVSSFIVLFLAVFFIGGLVRSGGGYFAGPALLAFFSLLLTQRLRRVEQ
jgi:hypothetical protein